MQRVDQLWTCRLGRPLDRLRQQLRGERRLRVDHQVERRTAGAGIGIDEAGGEATHGPRVEELDLFRTQTGEAAIGGGLQQQSGIGAPQHQRSREPDGRRRQRGVADHLDAGDGQRDQHQTVPENAPEAVYGAL